MTTPAKIMHFTLGPVQGFIADARRTRDFWAGSFLLSWLSGQAMAALVRAGEAAGREPNDIIIFPEVAGDELFEAIHTGSTNTNPYIGSLPNRFKANVEGIENPAAICKKAIEDSWDKLAAAVWEKFVKNSISKGNGTECIWRRQVDSFWDVNWVIGDDPQDGSDGQWLDQRKNWRSHFPTNKEDQAATEDGDLCRLMGRYQELSGFPRIGGKASQQEFWKDLSGKTSALNLRPDERLCAIALIKRLFPVLGNIEKIIGWRPGGDAVNIINWPSVSYIAAVPWLKQVEGKLSEAEWSVYWDKARENLKSGFMGETETRLFDLPKNGLFKLDGHLLHQDGIAQWPANDLNSNDEKGRQKARTDILSGLKTVEKSTGGPASEFYAILIMDGDSIGALVGKHPDVVKTGLAKFTQSVKEYFNPNEVRKNPANGTLIYAGGDDVLAFVPLDTAIEAALFLRQKYHEAFDSAEAQKTEEDFTLSAAIIFAQYKIPLRAVLKNAHHYIDIIAKEKNGRDSLAIAVMKPGGIAFDWMSCWKLNELEPAKTMQDIARDRSDYSSSFLYNIRERYAPLFQGDDPKGHSGAAAEFADTGLIEAVLVAEYKKQPGSGKLSFKAARSKVEPLITIGHPLIRKNSVVSKSSNYRFDAALVARFMSVEGCWNRLPKEEQTGEGRDEA